MSRQIRSVVHYDDASSKVDVSLFAIFIVSNIIQRIQLALPTLSVMLTGCILGGVKETKQKNDQKSVFLRRTAQDFL